MSSLIGSDSSDKPKGKLTIECDELWSFVDRRNNKYWVWLAIDRKTREIVGCYIGDRSGESAKKLWASLPPVYRQCAVAYKDFWDAYNTVIPAQRHRPVYKDSGETHHVERFNNTLRQRISRLVRETLSFSKKGENYLHLSLNPDFSKNSMLNFIKYLSAIANQ